MTRTPSRRVLACALLGLLVVAGCSTGPDDEMVRPEVTRTAAPEPPRHLPRLPVGKADLRPGQEVRVSDGVIRVGRRSVDVSPLRIDSWVLVPGGLYFLNRSELWFTDLTRAMPTPYKDVTELDLERDGTRLVFVDLDHGAPGDDGHPLPLRMEYDPATGRPVGSSYLPRQ